MKENFCKMCCAHHVGIRFYHKLVQCKSRCSNLVVGIDWRLTLPVNENKTDDNSTPVKKVNTPKSEKKSLIAMSALRHSPDGPF